YIEKMPEIIEDAGFFGSKVHEAISKALKGQDWQDTLSDLPYEQIEEAKIKVLTALKYSKSLGQIVGIETKFAIDEDFNAVDFDNENAFFRGIVDLITTDGRTFQVWDWKTGHSRPSIFQVMLYAYAISNILKMPVTKAGYILLSSGDLLEFDVDEDEMEITAKKIWKIIRKLESDQKFDPTPGMHCAYCSYVSQCPLVESIEAKDIPTIRNDQEAEEVFKTIQVLEEKVKRYKKALNGYVEKKDSGKVKFRDGIYKLEYSQYLTTKRGVNKKELATKAWEYVNQIGDDPLEYFTLDVKALEPFKDEFSDYLEPRKRKTFKFREAK
ncbi:MAG: hypothetical protein DRN17_04290, partial [Thermoplasmata archaeon]